MPSRVFSLHSFHTCPCNVPLHILRGSSVSSRVCPCLSLSLSVHFCALPCLSKLSALPEASSCVPARLSTRAHVSLPGFSCRFNSLRVSPCFPVFVCVFPCLLASFCVSPCLLVSLHIFSCLSVPSRAFRVFPCLARVFRASLRVSF